jgi:hypothetical protein
MILIFYSLTSRMCHCITSKTEQTSALMLSNNNILVLIVNVFYIEQIVSNFRQCSSRVNDKIHTPYNSLLTYHDQLCYKHTIAIIHSMVFNHEINHCGLYNLKTMDICEGKSSFLFMYTTLWLSCTWLQSQSQMNYCIISSDIKV